MRKQQTSSSIMIAKGSRTYLGTMLNRRYMEQKQMEQKQHTSFLGSLSKQLKVTQTEKEKEKKLVRS